MAAAEQKKSYQVIKQFKGVNTKANRTSIGEEEFSWLENAQPVGAGNLKITPSRGAVLDSGNASVTFANTVVYLTSANINNADYVIAFEDNGRAEFFNLTSSTKGNVAITGTFSNSGVQTSQWKDERLLIADPSKGYFTWNGNNAVFVGAVGPIGAVNAGTGYTSAPTIVISAPNDANGVQAQAEVTVSGGAINSITITEAGTGYNSAPTITISGGAGSGANLVGGLITFATGTVSCLITNPGSGYTNAANTGVTISGGGGSGATGTAIVAGNQVNTIIMTNPGSGYTNSANLTVSITGGAGANATATGVINSANNSGISSFSGRVWVSYGRTVAYSAASSYNDFTSVSAGTITLTDATLHGNIQQIISANNFLYIFGDDSINVFSDVRVDSTGNSLFTNTNVSASVGSKRPQGIFPYFRSVLFINDYGIYALVGSTTSKLSDPLDGVFPYIDFTYPVTSGQVLLNNILCAAFNFRQSYNGSARYVQAVFFEKKWFFTSQGDSLQYVVSAPFQGVINLYGVDSKALYKLYGGGSANVSSTVQTALLPMSDPIRDKQALKIGIEATLTYSGSLSVTVDSEVGSNPAYTLSSLASWTNYLGNTIPWTNNSSATIGWTNGGYNLYKTDAEQWGKYLGQTVTATIPGIVIHGFQFEHELRARF